MPRRPPISDEERELFRDAVAGARPLPESDTREHRKARPKPVPRQREADERAVLDELADALPDLDTETGDELLWRIPGIQDSVIRRLRRGHYRIDASLDLHGYTSKEAKVALTGFLHHAREHDAGCVRIVHGKGRGSKEGRPILKNRVAGWLRHHGSVLAYASARPADGGTGAVLVLLKRK